MYRICENKRAEPFGVLLQFNAVILTDAFLPLPVKNIADNHVIALPKYNLRFGGNHIPHPYFYYIHVAKKVQVTFR